jgi:tyrosyl-tRNA synthetase
MSFTEFTYQLLQANDYYHLFSRHDCRLQLGGSDQWGNILAGCDLIHKLVPADKRGGADSHAHGLTLPLLTSSTGEKFGKSAGNAIWLDPRQTAPFDLYQFFTTVDDQQAEALLMRLTFLPVEQVRAVMSEHERNRNKRQAQRLLADLVCQLVHGTEARDQARLMTRALYGDRDGDSVISGDDIQQRLDMSELIKTFEGDRRLYRLTMPSAFQSEQGPSIFDLAVQSGATSSKSMLEN